MNCFEWVNQSMESIEGTQAPQSKAGFDRHLESCPNCRKRSERFKTIRSAIAGLPRMYMPVNLRKNPALGTPGNGALSPKIKKSRWEDTPWYIRTSVEGLGTSLLILLVVALVPRIRILYERSLERRIENLSIRDLMSVFQISNPLNTSTEENSLIRGKKVDSDGDNLAADEDFLSDEGDADSGDGESDAGGDSDTSSPQLVVEGSKGSGSRGNTIRAGNSEIWRFNIRTDSPHELSQKVQKLLQESGVASNSKGLGGIEAPGGIQFDILIPSDTVQSIQVALNKLSEQSNPVPQETSNQKGYIPESFTWYRTKSKRKLPEKKTRIVIWLSQI